MTRRITELTKKIREEFSDYWDNLPLIIEQKSSKKMHHNYSSILAALSMGIYDPEIGKDRHVLNVNEMLEIIDTIHKLSLKKSSLYYHLGKMEEKGLVQKILEVQQGNIVTSYYGRTAKMVMTTMKEKEKTKPNPYNTLFFKEIIKKFSPDLQDEELDTLISQLGMEKKQYNTEFFDWIQNNAEKFKGLNIEAHNLNILFSNIQKNINGLYNTYKTLAEIFSIEKSSK